MRPLHRLLERQLRAHLGEEARMSAAVEALALAVSQAYEEFDADRGLLERSLDLSSRELVQANAEMRAIIQAFPDVFLWLSPDGTIVGHRAHDAGDLFLPAGEIEGRALQTLPGLSGAEGIEGALALIREGASEATVEFAVAGKPAARHYEARLVPLGKKTLMAVVRDVTARKNVEAQREASMSLLQATFESTVNGLLVVDLEGRIVGHNSRFLDMWNIPPEIMQEGSDDRALAHVIDMLADPAAFIARVRELYASPGTPSSDEIELRDGRIFERYSLPQRIGATIVGRVWSFHDVTEHRQAERRARESERRYRLLFERNPQTMWVYDAATLRFVSVNDAAVERYGYTKEQFMALSLPDLVPESDRDAFVADLSRNAGRDAFDTRARHARKDDGLMDVEMTSHRLELGILEQASILTLAEDVTNRRALEAQLLQSQKMEAIGRLAGGVAHDFNNLLTVILGYGQQLSRELEGHSLQTAVDQVNKAAGRAAGLTQQLLAFSRKQVVTPRILDLNAVISDAQPMLAALLGDRIELVIETDAAAGPILGDRVQIDQLLLNMAANARDAMPEGGALRVHTQSVREHPGREGHVRLTVADNGIGMNEDTRARLFEPFFTTKADGKGTGLGLAIVYGIVQRCNGSIAVHSHEGMGTSFEVLFPCSSGFAHEEAADRGKSRPGLSEGVILLVEDEEVVRTLARRVLEDRGYQVLEASNGMEAIEVMRGAPENVRLIITDVAMPHMDGPRAVRAIHKMRPDVPVLFMSGYTDDDAVLRGVQDQGIDFLQKPFLPDALTHRVQEILSRTAIR